MKIPKNDLINEGSRQEEKSHVSMDTFYSFWGCFFLTSEKLFVDENGTKCRNLTPKNGLGDNLTPGQFGTADNLTPRTI